MSWDIFWTLFTSVKTSVSYDSPDAMISAENYAAIADRRSDKALEKANIKPLTFDVYYVKFH